jgi:hypothetical protein
MLDEEEIAQQRHLLMTYRRNLALLLQQQAAQGGVMYIQPAVANGIRETRQNIQRIKSILRASNVESVDHPDDDELVLSLRSSWATERKCVVLRYSFEDKHRAGKLYERLQAAALNVVLYLEEVLPASNSPPLLLQGTPTADTVIICLSQQSIARTDYVRQAVKSTLSIAGQPNEDRVFVILLRLEPCTLTQELTRWQLVDTSEVDWYEVLLRLVQSHAHDMPITVAPLAQPINSGRNSELPESYGVREEPRRLDVAMPSRTVVNRPTELWLQVCLPSSEGFRSSLPQYTRSTEEITRGDVRATTLPVAFPLDIQTGNPRSVHLLAELTAPDFSITKSQEDILLPTTADSGLVTFVLIPNQTRHRSIIHVTIKQRMEDGSLLALGSASLSTQVTPSGARLIVQAAWTLVTLMLTSMTVGYTSSADHTGEPAHARIPMRPLDPEEQDDIEKYLILDEPLLHSLIPPYDQKTKHNIYSPDGQMAEGKRLFMELQPAVYAKLCEEWKLCDKLDELLLMDDVKLVAIIGDIIASIVGEIPPHLIAAIIVKMGIRTFCKCS